MDWYMLEFEQLNQYYAQDIFDNPVLKPPCINVLPLVWTYFIKYNGTKKAQCVWNGSPSWQGSLILAHAYTASLDQAGARKCWAIAALHDYTVYGEDDTNDFSHAQTHNSHVYVTIGQHFKSGGGDRLETTTI